MWKLLHLWCILSGNFLEWLQSEWIWAYLWGISRILPGIEGKWFQVEKTEWPKFRTLKILGLLRDDGQWCQEGCAGFWRPWILCQGIFNWAIENGEPCGVFNHHSSQIILFLTASTKALCRMTSQKTREDSSQLNINLPVLYHLLPVIFQHQSLAAKWTHKNRWKSCAIHFG
jgi:hypothetical protein